MAHLRPALDSDHLGSTSLATDAGGAPLPGSDTRYFPFGQVRSGGDLPTDFGYTGQRLDATGLMFYHARYYAPQIGRFIQADTIVPNPGSPQDFNRYTYVRNNPLRLIDPSGHRTCGPNADPRDETCDENMGNSDYGDDVSRSGLSPGTLDIIGTGADVGLAAAENSELAMWYARGLRITRSANQPTHWIIRGTRFARRGTGLIRNNKLPADHPKLASFNTTPSGVWRGAIDAIKSKWTAASVGVATLIDVYDCQFGPNASYGHDSPEFVAAVTVDVGINLVSAAAGGATAGLIAGPPGIVAGAVTGILVNLALNFFARDPVHEAVTNVYSEAGQFLSGAAYVATHGFPLIVEPAPNWCGAPDCNW